MFNKVKLTKPFWVFMVPSMLLLPNNLPKLSKLEMALAVFGDLAVKVFFLGLLLYPLFNSGGAANYAGQVGIIVWSSVSLVSVPVLVFIRFKYIKYLA